MADASTPAPGTHIDETGTLLRDASGFLLQRDLGGTWRLVLHRLPVDHVAKHVRIRGIHAGGGVVEADGVGPA